MTAKVIDAAWCRSSTPAFDQRVELLRASCSRGRSRSTITTGAVPHEPRHSHGREREAAVRGRLARRDAEPALFEMVDHAFGAAHRAREVAARLQMPAADGGAPELGVEATALPRSGCAARRGSRRGRRCRRRPRSRGLPGSGAGTAAPSDDSKPCGKRAPQDVELGRSGASPVALPADHVDRAEGRHDVGELAAARACGSAAPMCTKLGERTHLVACRRRSMTR